MCVCVCMGGLAGKKKHNRRVAPVKFNLNFILFFFLLKPTSQQQFHSFSGGLKLFQIFNGPEPDKIPTARYYLTMKTISPPDAAAAFSSSSSSPSLPTPPQKQSLPACCCWEVERQIHKHKNRS